MKGCGWAALLVVAAGLAVMGALNYLIQLPVAHNRPGMEISSSLVFFAAAAGLGALSLYGLLRGR